MEGVIGMMYFDGITIFKDEPEYSNVGAYCGDCGRSNLVTMDKVAEIAEEDHIILKEGITVRCKGCGKVHEGNKITYKPKSRPVTNLPRCPICQSTNLKKITAGSKVLAAVTIGNFAIPYTSKIFECKNCGYKF